MTAVVYGPMSGEQWLLLLLLLRRRRRRRRVPQVLFIIKSICIGHFNWVLLLIVNINLELRDDIVEAHLCLGSGMDLHGVNVMRHATFFFLGA